MAGNVDRDGLDQLGPAVAAREHVQSHRIARADAGGIQPDALDGRRARPLRRRDLDVDAVDLERRHAVVQQGRQRVGDRPGRAEQGGVAAVDVLERNVGVAADARRAAEGIRRRPALAGPRQERAEHAGVGQQRREQPILDDLERELARQPPRRLVQPDADGNHGRPRSEHAEDARRAVLIQGSDDLPDGRDLRREGEARQQRGHGSPGHREANRPQVVERVAEGVDAAVIHERDGAGAGHGQVAAHERRTDRIARLQGRGRIRARSLAGADGGDEAAAVERGGPQLPDLRIESVEHHRRGDGLQQGAQPLAGRRRQAERAHVVGLPGERTRPVERPADHGLQVGGRCRKRRRPRRRPRDRGPVGVRRGHLADRRDAGDGLPGKRAQRVGDGADQPVVDVDGAAAHALDDPGFGQRPAGQPGHDDVAARAHDVAQHAQDLDPELLAPGAVEHGEADAAHARPHLVEGHARRCGRERRDAQAGCQAEDGGDSSHGADAASAAYSRCV